MMKIDLKPTGFPEIDALILEAKKLYLWAVNDRGIPGALVEYKKLVAWAIFTVRHIGARQYFVQVAPLMSGEIDLQAALLISDGNYVEKPEAAIVRMSALSCIYAQIAAKSRKSE